MTRLQQIDKELEKYNSSYGYCYFVEFSIYLITDDIKEYLKIGRTDNLQSRIYQYKSSNPHNVTLIHAHPIKALKHEAGIYIDPIEKEILAMFKQHRYNKREWFYYKQEIIDRFKLLKVEELNSFINSKRQPAYHEYKQLIDEREYIINNTENTVCYQSSLLLMKYS